MAFNIEGVVFLSTGQYSATPLWATFDGRSLFPLSAALALQDNLLLPHRRKKATPWNQFGSSPLNVQGWSGDPGETSSLRASIKSSDT